MRLLTWTTCLFLFFSLPCKANDAAEVIDFDQALQSILDRDTALGAERSRLSSVRATTLPARFTFLPSITAAHSELRNNSRATGITTDTQRGYLSSSWNLFRGGSDIAGWFAADADVSAGEASLSKQFLSSELDAAQRIFSLILVRKQVEISKKLYSSERENHKIATLRFEKGLLPRQEVEKVFIDLVNSQARLKNAEILEAEAQEKLSAALGHSRIRIDWPWSEIFLDAKAKLSDREFHLNRVPAFIQAQGVYERERQRTKRDFRRMLPSLDFQADYNFRNTTTTRDEWSGALTLSLPIFDQMTNYARYASQAGKSAAAEFDLEEARRKGEAEYRSARATFLITLDTALARQETLGIARRLYRDNEIRFKSGKINANDLSVDQERLFRSEQFALEGWNAAHVAFVRLCHSTGSRLQNCLKDE
jgi:outer membrane protein TolC